MRIGVVCAGLAAIAAVGVVGVWGYDRYEFRKDQATWLRSFVPGANCDDAAFTVLEREEGIQDSRYVVRIVGSARCRRSLRAGLMWLHAAPSSQSDGRGELLLPGHRDTEREQIGFDFDSEPGVVIWTRDKT